MESGAIAEERVAEAPAEPVARDHRRRNAVIGLGAYVIATASDSY